MFITLTKIEHKISNIGAELYGDRDGGSKDSIRLEQRRRTESHRSQRQSGGSHGW